MHENDDIPETTQAQLERAVRDLWSMVQDSGQDYVVFMDRRRLSTRVERTERDRYRVSWEGDDGTWLEHERDFENPREAAFHAYQGPH
jgi:hypothetical protein